MVDYLPAKFLNPGRDQLAADFRRDYGFRNPAADVGTGSQPYLDSLVVTDAILPLFTYADRVSRGTNWMTAVGPDLDVWLQSFGTQRLQAVGAVGYVQISASGGGTYLVAGDQGTCNGFTYKVTASGLYQNGAEVPVIGVDTGPQTNQRAGSTFKFNNPRPGCGPNATVVLQPDGTGLSRGANAESDGDARRRISLLKSNPPGSGNDAMIQLLVSQTGAVPVQQCFTYPGCMGAGSTGLSATIRPAQSGATRIASSAQMSLIMGYVQGLMPASDQLYPVILTAYPITIVFRALWSLAAPGWADASPFPLYQAPTGTTENNWLITSTVTPTASTFNIKSLTDTTVPQAGQSIGVFNLTTQSFSRKRILTATSAGGGYTISVDPSNGVSDLTYTPTVGQLVCPWSDSLNSVVAPTLAYFDSIGPGEQFASFFDPGLRQKRSPASPALWSSQIANRMIGGPPNASQPPDPNALPTPTLLSTANLADVELAEIVNSALSAYAFTAPYTTPVGNPAVSANLLTCGGIAVYPE